MEKNFVDSHGQSEVAFAFCHLLGTVRLMACLKRIKYERLYLLQRIGSPTAIRIFLPRLCPPNVSLQISQKLC